MNFVTGVMLLTALQGSNAFVASLTAFTRQSVGLFLEANANPRSKIQPKDTGTKRIVFIRHGCTYMNEYLGNGNEFGSPNFSDVFESAEDLDKYRDSKLSPLGVTQAKALSQRFTKALDSRGRQQSAWNRLFPGTDGNEENHFTPSDLDLVVVSPLTRALQTFELGLRPHLKETKPNIVALPLAAERVYLISDQGMNRSDLESRWGNHICFETGFRLNNNQLIEEWWFGLDDRRARLPAVPTGITSESYQEWRPSSQNQRYACPGEDDHSFEKRMRKLYRWLGDRPESTIAVVCHWGVIDWFLDRDFRNCEVGVVPFDAIRPPSLVKEEALKQST
ncbi:Histidine phosphatase [Fragilaria crotonensis]|nr:Histidine phosphatase [Fragilaria crotonensis]